MYVIIPFKQAGFTYSACERFTKHRGIIEKFTEIGNFRQLDRTELEKPSFVQEIKDTKDRILKLFQINF